MCEELHAALEVVDRLLPNKERGKIQFRGPDEDDRSLVRHILPELERPEDYRVFSLDIEGPLITEHFLLIPHPRVATIPLTGEKTMGFAAIWVDQTDGELGYDPEACATDKPCGIAIWAMETLLGTELTPNERKLIKGMIYRVINARFSPIEYSYQKEKLHVNGPILPGRRPEPKAEAIVVSLPPDPLQNDWGSGVSRADSKIL